MLGRTSLLRSSTAVASLLSPCKCARPTLCRHLQVAAQARSRKGSSGTDKVLPRAVRAVPIRVVTVSKGNSQGATLMAEEWSTKIRRYTPLARTQIKPNPKRASEPEVAVQGEGEKVLKSLTQQERVILLDERGREVSSADMADILVQAGEIGASGLTFCIGGPYGHSSAVRQRADDSIRLSRMVLNHQVAHVVLLEQIYRGWTILRAEPYHH